MKKEQSVVIAIKGGVERSFTEQVWKEMPADKYGWMPKVEEPEEVTEAKAKKKQEEDEKKAAALASQTEPSKPATKPEEVTEAKADTKAPAQATEAKKPEADKPKTVEKVNSKKH